MDNVRKAIDALKSLQPMELDGCNPQELAQFMYWTQRHQGSVFLKVVGKLTHQQEHAARAKEDAAAAVAS